MTTTKRNWFRRSLSLFLALAMILSMSAVKLLAENEGQNTNTKAMAEQYIVPIKSLVSSAPLPPVQTAFAKAFGESVTVIGKEDGTKTARIKTAHMVVDMAMMNMGKFDANVASIVDADASTDEIEKAVVIATKEAVFSNSNGNLAGTPVQTLQFRMSLRFC